MDNNNNTTEIAARKYRGQLTADETAALFPIGSVAMFLGYMDGIGASTGAFRPYQLVEIVGHDDTCFDDGLLVRRFYRGESGRRGRQVGLVSASELGMPKKVAP